MKNLTVPYIPDLGGISPERRAEILESEGGALKIDVNNWPELFPDSPETIVRIAHDGKNLYVDFNCSDYNVKAEVAENLGPVASDSCVEFFVMPDAATGRYWNFEFNAIGRKNVSTRIVRSEPRRLTSEELDSIHVVTSEGTEPFPEKTGPRNWWLRAVIPLSLIGVKYEGSQVAMAANFYKCAGRTSTPHYLSWNPIESEKPDFHRKEFFGTLTLE